MFENPIRKVKVRNGIYAYEYSQLINICGEKYSGYSMTEAITLWRRKNPYSKQHSPDSYNSYRPYAF